jgi:hypothetical protein
MLRRAMGDGKPCEFDSLVELLTITTGVDKIEPQDGYVDPEAHFRVPSGRILRASQIYGQPGFTLTVFESGLSRIGRVSCVGIPTQTVADIARVLVR